MDNLLGFLKSRKGVGSTVLFVLFVLSAFVNDVTEELLGTIDNVINISTIINENNISSTYLIIGFSILGFLSCILTAYVVENRARGKFKSELKNNDDKIDCLERSVAQEQKQVEASNRDCQLLEEKNRNILEKARNDQLNLIKLRSSCSDFLNDL
jgi:hypothetical protein